MFWNCSHSNITNVYCANYLLDYYVVLDPEMSFFAQVCIQVVKHLSIRAATRVALLVLLFSYYHSLTHHVMALVWNSDVL